MSYPARRVDWSLTGHSTDQVAKEDQSDKKKKNYEPLLLFTGETSAYCPP